MKLLMATTLFLTSTLSLASGVWDVTNHSNAELKTETEITNALATYPQILTNWQGDADEIKYLHLTVINFEWTGETVCPVNDPRLKHEAVNFIACPDENITPKCLIEFDPVLTPFGDPCKE